MPRVSVVMPCYNAAAHLAASVGSVLAQSLEDWELVAVDDGSRDGTWDALTGFGDARIRPFRQANNAGVSSARNVGLEHARGEFVAFLDADDTWHTDFLVRMHGALSSRTDAGLAYCGWQNAGLPGPRGKPFVPPDYETPAKSEKLVEGCRWPIHAALTRRSLVERAGGFDCRFAVGEDFLLWMEIAIFHPIVRVPEVLAYYHHHGGTQATSNRVRAALQTLAVKRAFLDRHPELVRSLGRKRVREVLLAPFLVQAYERYWERDLDSARALFSYALKCGYFRPRDLPYMLPSLMPASLHRALIRAVDRRHRT